MDEPLRRRGSGQPFLFCWRTAMTANDSKHQPISDDDLLANAIPIDMGEEEEQPAPDSGDPQPIEMEESGSGELSSNKIRAFDRRVRHDSKWKRQPNLTGQGAIHVKTFVAKLRLDAIEHLDEQINEWLDSNPEYEVKMVTSTVGQLVGKLTEDALFVNVWV
jgi:hypothetical protein